MVSPDIVEDYLVLTAQKKGMILEHSELNIVNYMARFARNYVNCLQYIETNKHCYFGYHNGLGIKFTTKENLFAIQIDSIGCHSNYKLN